MGNPLSRAALALTIATTAYTAGDVVGGLLSFDVSSAPEGGILNRVTITDAANQKEPYVLWLFNAAPTTIADDAAFAPAIADLKKVVGTITIAAADYVTVNSLAIAQVNLVNQQFPANTGTLYGYLVATDTPDYAAATDLWLALDLVPQARGR